MLSENEYVEPKLVYLFEFILLLLIYLLKLLVRFICFYII